MLKTPFSTRPLSVFTFVRFSFDEIFELVAVCWGCSLGNYVMTAAETKHAGPYVLLLWHQCRQHCWRRGGIIKWCAQRAVCVTVVNYTFLPLRMNFRKIKMTGRRTWRITGPWDLFGRRCGNGTCQMIWHQPSPPTMKKTGNAKSSIQ